MILKVVFAGITLWFFYYIIMNTPIKIMKGAIIVAFVLIGLWFAVDKIKKTENY